MNLPKLPEPIEANKYIGPAHYYTEAQMIQFQRETLEACARIAEGHYGDGHRLAEELRALK